MVCLIETIGSIVKLLAVLDKRDDLFISTQEHHYSVKTDLTACEILDRCLQVLSDVVLEEKPMATVKHYQSIINRLFTAATIIGKNDLETETSYFPTDIYENTIFRTTSSSDHHYDADDSASASSDENDRRKNVKPDSPQPTIIISNKIISHIVEMLIGLGKKEPGDNFCKVIEYGIAKLATLSKNVENQKRLVKMDLCLKLLSGLGHIVLKKSSGTLVETFFKLITILASHKMSREEFVAMIGFFKCSPALSENNVALVLENLHRIVSETSCPATEQPSAFLTFQSGAYLMNK